MKVTKIQASIAVKVNLGNYQSVDVWTHAEAELDPIDDDEEIAALRLHQHLERITALKILRSTKARGKQLSEDEVRLQYGLNLGVKS